MAFCKLNIGNKTLIIFITSIIWALNFRSTFKNIDDHMDLGSYATLKFNPRLILIKNFLCILFFIFFYIEIKLGKTYQKNEKKVIIKKEDDIIIIEEKNEIDAEHFFNSIYISHRIKTKTQKIKFFIKKILTIIVIYIIEESYFLICNNHILERILCPTRNLFLIVSLLIFYPLINKKCYVLYRHQKVPLIIIICLLIFLIIYTRFKSERFPIIFTAINSSCYIIIFILTGLETILIKNLTDKDFLNIFLIMGLKGIVGTFVFFIIIFFYNEKKFFYFFDKILTFEYEDIYEEFDLYQQIIYVITQIIVQYLKIYIINKFTETHFLYCIMITDILYFPLYCIERLFIQEFIINIPELFFSNLIVATISFILFLIINEIVECNFWNCSFDIRNRISQRQFYETLRENALN